MGKYLFSGFIALVLSSLFYTQCSQLKLPERGRLQAGGDDRGGSSPRRRTAAQSRYDDEDDRDDEGDDDDDRYPERGGSRRVIEDSDCLYGLDSCDDDDEDEEREPESVSAEYRKLRDRYGKGYANLDIDPDQAEDFMAGEIVNYEITDGRVYVDLKRVKSEKYYKGKVVIAVKEEYQKNKHRVRETVLNAGSNTDAKYNVWARFKNNQQGFHGFFTDTKYGAVILVLNPGRDALAGADGDRKRIRRSSGSLWFMNFKTYTGNNHKNCYEGGEYIGRIGRPPHPPKKCWFIKSGPFDCRSWFSGKNDVDTLNSLEPSRNSCYQKLADFDHLNIEEAFNTEDDNDEVFFLRK